MCRTVGPDTQIALNGAYAQLPSADLVLSADGTQTVAMQVKGTATIAGGSLQVVLPKSWKGDGQTITLIRAQNLQGQFTSIQLDGFKATPVYAGGELRLQLSL